LDAVLFNFFFDRVAVAQPLRAGAAVHLPPLALIHPNPNLFFFSLLLNDLKKASLAIASLLFFALHFLINLTGSRLLVYFPPLPD